MRIWDSFRRFSFGRTSAQRKGQRRGSHTSRPSKARNLRVEQFEQRVLLSISPTGLDEPDGLSAQVGTHPDDFRDVSPANVNAADTINTDQLQPGGALSLGLEGAGYTVGIWDIGHVRDTHQELVGRVSISDATLSNYQDHATQVAGTIAAAGVDPAAQGMGPQLSLLSYDTTDDMIELGAAASTIVVSNHSYSTGGGWAIHHETDFPIAIPTLDTPSDWIDVWVGDRSLYDPATGADGEDPEFGKYGTDAVALDQVLYTNSNLLSVWAAGNERGEGYINTSTDGRYVAYFSQDHPAITASGGTWSGPSMYVVDATVADPAPPNDGDGGTGFDSLSPAQTAKNSLVVGAVNDIAVDPYDTTDVVLTSFSSFGPTDDGRVKPDVVANGAGLYSLGALSDTDYITDMDPRSSGTSFAAPSVSGTAALLIEHFANEFGSAPSSATTKGALIHTAFDAGTTGPDYSHGWGLVDAAGTAEFISNAAAGIATDVLVEQTYAGIESTTTFDFQGMGPLKATLVWTDPAGTAHGSGTDLGTPALVNDLDLWIEGPNGTFMPWTLDPTNPMAPALRTTANHVDNVEQVVISRPAPGTYTIHVGATGSVTNQPFSLLISDASLDLAAGPELVEIVTNAGAPLADGDTIHISPRELLLRFSPDQVIDPNTLDGIQVIRSVDGTFGNTDASGNVLDEVVEFGWIGIGDYENEVIIRFVDTLPDDTYQIIVVGSNGYTNPDNPLIMLGPVQNDAGIPFHRGQNEVYEFILDLGVQVVAVVPMPVTVDSIDVQTTDPANFRDGHTFVVKTGDQASESQVTFEFDDASSGAGDGVATGHVAILFDNSDDAASIAAKIVTAIGTTSLQFDSVSSTGDIVTLVALTSTPGGYVVFDSADTSFTFSQNLSQSRDTIDVYFDADSPLDPTQAEDPRFYTLLHTNETADPTDDIELAPTSAAYDSVENKVTLTFDQASLDANPGSYRLRIGNEYQPDGIATDHLPEQTTDAGQSFYTTQVLSGAEFGGQSGPHSMILSAEIEVQPFGLEFPGAIDEPGHRDMSPQRNFDNTPLYADHYQIDGSSTDTTSGITLLQYNFGDVIGFDPTGSSIPNLITEAQKQRAREIFDLYGYYMGVQFEETEGRGLLVATGDLRAAGFASAPGGYFSYTDWNSALQTSYALMDYADFDTDPGFFGGEWFNQAMRAIGFWLGFGRANDLPEYTTMGWNWGGTEATYPGDNDIIHGLHMYRPDSIDIDLYQFTLAQAGTFQAETLAERMEISSQVDTVVTLYEEYQEPDPDGTTVTKYRVIARNDDYYGNDSYIDMHLGAGTYFVSVTASGNTDYDPKLDDTGLGGTSQGDYDLRLNFTPGGIDPDDPTTFRWDGTGTPTYLVDEDGTYMDGDADGVPGGVYDFWFNVQDDTIFVDKTADPAAADGSLANPYTEIDNAFAAAQPDDIVRVVGNNFQDDDPNLYDDDDPNDPATYLNNDVYENNRAYHIGAGLSDGATMRVPRGVTVMIDAGAMFKLSRENIDVGSLSQGEDRSSGALQVLGTPGDFVYFTSALDETMGDDSNPAAATTPARGDWGGLVFRNDLDYDFINNYSVNDPSDPTDLGNEREVREINGIFLDYVNHADIRYGGGLVNIYGNTSAYAPIHLIESRPTISFNVITESKGGAISADPDSFADTKFQNWDFSERFVNSSSSALPFTADYDRVGPDIHGNLVVDNAVNGLFVRADTVVDPGSGKAVAEKVDRPTRFDDWDIVHVVSQNLMIEGNPGGPILRSTTTNLALIDGNHIHVPSAGGVADIADAETFTLFDGTTRVTFEMDSGGGVISTHVQVPFSPTDTAEEVAQVIETTINAISTYSAVPNLGLGVTASEISPNSNDGIVSLTHRTTVLDTEGFATWNYDPNTGENTARADGTPKTRLNARLAIDPAVVVKLDNARIEVETGSQLIVEGRLGASNGGPGSQVILTSFLDNRYGAGGTFNTAQLTGIVNPRPGDWIGLYFSPLSEGSLDNVVIAYAGGETSSGGTFHKFDPIEIRQAHVRITNSRFENNGANSDGDRDGHGSVQPATIFVRGAQPVVAHNDFFNNSGPILHFDSNSLNADYVPDWGRSTADIGTFSQYSDNYGPLIRGNRMAQTSLNPNTQLHGMQVRGGTLTTASIWDDTDITHIVRNEITVLNYHHEGGLRLQSSPDASLVIKLDGNNAGFTADGVPLEIDDRIGGALQVLGMPGFPVILTSLDDDEVGAGVDLQDQPQLDTNGDRASQGSPGDWRSLQLNTLSHDRNIPVINERELAHHASLPGVLPADENAIANNAQFLGHLAPFEKAGDDTLRLGFEIHGHIRDEDARDVDLYRFMAVPGTEIWLDIDNTSQPLDAVVELVSSTGQVLARSDNSTDELSDATLQTLSPGLDEVYMMDRNLWLRHDFYTVNPRDPGMRLVLPGPAGGELEYYVRVRSSFGIGNLAAARADGGTLAFDVSDGSQTVPISIDAGAPGSLTEHDLADQIAAAVNAAGLNLTARVQQDVRTDRTVTQTETDIWNVVLDGTYANLDPLATPLTRLANTSGAYQLQLRLREMQEVPGSAIQYADIRYATTGIELNGLPTHSPLLGESTESPGNNSGTGNAQSVGNLLAIDRNTISVAGALSNTDDVDWYEFTVDHNGIVSNPGTIWPTVFDIDYADGMARPDTTLYIFDSAGRLILVGGDSNIVDDQPDPTAVASLTDLPRGSMGPADPFIGTAYLPEGNGDSGRYYAAISSVLNTSDILDPLRASRVRREPISSSQLIAVEHVDTQPYNTLEANLRLTLTPDEFHLGDVTMYLLSGNDLYSVDPFTGNVEVDVSGPANGNTVRLPNYRFTNYGDLAMRDDGRLMTTTDASGTGLRMEYHQIDTGNAANFANTDPNQNFTINTFRLNGATPPGLQAYNAYFNTRAMLHGRDNSNSDSRYVFVVGSFGASNGTDLTGLINSGGRHENVVYLLDANGKALNHPQIRRWGMAGGSRLASDIVPMGQLVSTVSTGEITGLAYIGSQLYAVDDEGWLFEVNNKNGSDVSGTTGAIDSGASWGFNPTNPSNTYRRYSLSNGGPELTEVGQILYNGQPIVFSGLATGPSNVEGGRYDDILFATDTNGDVYAMNTDGELLPVFEGGETQLDTNLRDTTTGIDFSPIDYNLWHQTQRRRHDSGHGYITTWDHSREPGVNNISSNTNRSWYFGLQNTAPTAEVVQSQSGAGRFKIGPGANSGALNTYDMPGGAHGSLTSSVFSLDGYDLRDRPTLYFNYLLDTQGGDAYDGAKLYISDDGAEWHALASNTDLGWASRSPNTPGANTDTHSWDVEVTGASDTYFQELHEQSGTWRQARVDLAGFLNATFLNATTLDLTNLRIRFDFSTASDMNIGHAYTAGSYLAAVPAWDIDDGDTFNIIDDTINIGQTFEFDAGWSIQIPNTPGVDMFDGESFTINDGVNPAVRFEFDTASNGILNPSATNIEIDVIEDDTTFDVTAKTWTALNNARIGGVLDTTPFRIDPAVDAPAFAERGDRILLPGVRTVTQAGVNTALVIHGDAPGTLSNPWNVRVPVWADLNGNGSITSNEANADQVARLITKVVNQYFDADLPTDGADRIVTVDPGLIGDGQTFTIEGFMADGIVREFTFEFDKNGFSWPGRIRVDISTATTPFQVAQAIAAAVNGIPEFQVTGTPFTDEVRLGWSQGGTVAFVDVSSTGLDPVNDQLDFPETTIKLDSGLGYFMHVIGANIGWSGPLGSSSWLEGDDQTVGPAHHFNNNARGQNNRNEGFFIDDIIIGFAERGEMVLSSPGDMRSFTNQTSSRITDPIVTQGEYQLEIRRGEDYGTRRSLIQNSAWGWLDIHHKFDTNDRLAREITLFAPQAADLGHDDSFTINDGINIQEFRLYDQAHTLGSGSYVAIVFNQGDSASRIANRIRDAINNTTTLNVTATSIDISERIDLFGATEVTVAAGTDIDQMVWGAEDPATAPTPPFTMPNSIPTWAGGTYVNRGLDHSINADLGDTNLYREKGQVIIDSNWITHSSQWGIRVGPDNRGSGGQSSGDPSPHPGSVRHFNTPGRAPYDLLPGVLIENNVVAFNQVGGIQFSGETGNPAGAVPFGRIVNNTVAGGTQTTPSPFSNLIDFETIPFTTPTETMPIYDQFLSSHGVTFVYADGTQPMLAQLGSPRTAFQGYPSGTGDDALTPGQEVGIGQFFLTDPDLFGATTAAAHPLLVQYSQLTDSASGVFLDLDGGTLGAPNFPIGIDEEWTIDALDANGQVLQSRTIRAGDPGTGDGMQTPWSINVGAPLIQTIRFTYTGNKPAANIGFALDNFRAYGSSGPSASAGAGIQVRNNASPTLLNNIVADLNVGIDVDNSSNSTVIGYTTYKNNNQNVAGAATVGSTTQVLTQSQPLFVDSANENFYLRHGSPAIDSSIDEFDERLGWFQQMLNPIGIPESPVRTPELDVYGQIREDDLTAGAGSGGTGFGSEVFFDRGAIDRVDFDPPTALLVTPIDGPPRDRDPANYDVLYVGEQFTEFQIELFDGTGVGIADTTVMSSNVRIYRGLNPDFVTTPPLQEGAGFDYRFHYDNTNNVIRLVPTAGSWDDDVYTIVVDNSASGIRDLADNALMMNRFPGVVDGPVAYDNLVVFTITLAGMDFGDAPDPSYPTLLESDGARHVIDGKYYLGTSGPPSSEGNAIQRAAADGDVGDNGVQFNQTLVAGEAGVPLAVSVTTPLDPTDPTVHLAGHLDAWIDFNNDGDFSDAGEQIASSDALAQGTQPTQVIIDIPDGDFNGGVIPFAGNAELYTMARFRFSKDGGLTPTGEAPDGEVEDYQIRLVPYAEDYGDAPNIGPSGQAWYPTLFSQDGARHQINTAINLFLGTDIDPDRDGQPDSTATGDDLDHLTNPLMVDDEQGIFFVDPLIPGTQGTRLDITVDGVTSAGGTAYLNAWIDLNANGDWADPHEQIVWNDSNGNPGALGDPLTITANGTQQFTFNMPTLTDVPDMAVGGNTFMRFRLSTEPDLLVNGPAPDGEVEDYQVSIVASAEDFGDAPDPGYPTLLASDGARHTLSPGFHLGQYFDYESDSPVLPTDVTATADDLDVDATGLDDEDGIFIVLPDPWNPGQEILQPFTGANLRAGSQVTLEVLASIPAGRTGYLNAWVDFTGNQDWDDTFPDGTTEKIFDGEPLVDGPNRLKFTVPDGLDSVDTFARFRFSSTQFLSYDTPTVTPMVVPDGEVEDYAVSVVAGDAKIQGWKFNDLNADGVWNTQGTSAGPSFNVHLPLGSGQTVLIDSDDGTTGPLYLGFVFEFFGNQYNQIYVNNNGNVTFGRSWTSPSPADFPNSFLPPILAPFWADVDTQNNGGSVHLFRGITSTGNAFVQVDWVNVGYFPRFSSTNTNARNTFSLYLENDAGGDIVGFAYDNMQWTNNWSGAQIGFDAGDGINYLSETRPMNQADLAALPQQYSYRFNPSTGGIAGVEPGLAGVLVYLDTNDNSKFDYIDNIPVDGLFDPLVDTNLEPYMYSMADDPATAQNETGYYEFDKLFADTYIVREDLSNSLLVGNWAQTSPATVDQILPIDTWQIRAVDVIDGLTQTRAIDDGETFAILADDGINPVTLVTFEFDNPDDPAYVSGVISGSRVQVNVTDTSLADDVAAAMVSAIQGSSLNTSLTVNQLGEIVNLTAFSGVTISTPATLLPAPVMEANSRTRHDGQAYYEAVLDRGEVLDDVNFGNFKIPHVSLIDAVVSEGDFGRTQVQVTVNINESFGAPITIHYETVDGTATVADNDYDPVVNGQFTIPPQGTPSAVWTTQSLTSNQSNDYDYSISGDRIVWESSDGDDIEVHLATWDASTSTFSEIRQVTDNAVNDYFSVVNDDYIAFVRGDGDDAEIWYWDGTAEFQVTNNPYPDTTPQLGSYVDANNNTVSYLVWEAQTPMDQEIYFWEIGNGNPQLNAVQITNNVFNDFDPQTSGPNIVWTNFDGFDQEIFLYRADVGTVQQLSNNSTRDRHPMVSDSNVVWVGHDGNDSEIFLWDISASDADPTYQAEQITDNTVEDIEVRISDDDIVWTGHVGSNSEIFHYNTANKISSNISSNSRSDESPHIYGNRVVWNTYSGSNWEVSFYELGSLQLPVNISNRYGDDWKPQISDELLVWRSYDGEDYEIVVAAQGTPSLGVTITLNVIGDLNLEWDEFFSVLLTDAHLAGVPGFHFNYDSSPITVTILNDDGLLDFGDAPYPYPTLLAHNGARHITSGSQVELITASTAGVDNEADGQPDVDATGDDNHGGQDEDGIVFDASWVSGTDAAITVNVSDTRTSPAASYLDAWADFNADGIWDTSEQIFTDEPVYNGANSLQVAIPSNLSQGNIYTRFRLASDPTYVTSYVGSAQDGEVEDYLVPIVVSKNLTLSIATTSVSEADGVAATTGTVTRNNATDLSSPVTVMLSSSDTGEATVPSFVVIPVDQVSATFDIAAVDDLVVDATQTVTITASATDYISDTETLDVTESTTIVDLGSITMGTYPFNYTPGDYWYSLDSTNDAFLTAEVLQGNVVVTLYDENFVPLATHPGRLDYLASANTRYYLQVQSTTSQPVAFRLTNLVNQQGDAVTVNGTSNDDLFEFTAGVLMQVEVNGVSYDFDMSAVNTIDLDGALGNDEMIFNGSTRDESATLWPDHAEFRDAGVPSVVVTAGSVESSMANMDGGNDSVTMYGTDNLADLEQLRAQPDSAVFTGPNLSLVATGYETLDAYANATGNPDPARDSGAVGAVAFLYDSPDSDHYYTDTTLATLSGPNSNFVLNAHGFFNAHGYATSGGYDTAEIRGSSSDDNVFFHKDAVRIYDPGGTDSTNSPSTNLPRTYFRRAKHFEDVVVHSDANGADVAFLLGSRYDDVFTGRPNQSVMETNVRTTLAGREVDRTITANDFDRVHAFGRDGTNTANLYDSSGKDHLEAGLPASDPLHWARVYSDPTSALDYLYYIEAFEEATTWSTNAEDEADVDPDAVDAAIGWLTQNGWF